MGFSSRSVVEQAGHRGSYTETGTTALTATSNGGPWSEIQILEEATFATLTDDMGGGDAMTGFAIPAGLTLFGYFTAVTLTSGKIRLYKAPTAE